MEEIDVLIDRLIQAARSAEGARIQEYLVSYFDDALDDARRQLRDKIAVMLANPAAHPCPPTPL